MKPVAIFVFGVAMSATWFAFAGCKTTKVTSAYKTTWARLFLESNDARGTAITLPQSGVQLVVNAQPVVTEGDIVNVELAQVELGRCLLFQLTPAAARDFYRLTGSHQGKRLVLVIDDATLGARRIDGAIADGNWFTFVEVADDALPKLVENLKRSSVALQKEIARKK